ncbi:MAG TPA: hypothetical protein VJS45_13725, partial [Acidimicrobiia bacterium]|nr:hypothetical protein [Acidimicrobiia bacterium]
EVTLRLGSYLFVAPAGSFALADDGAYAFTGTLTGVRLSVALKPAKGGGWSVKANGKTVTLSNPVPVGLSIGDDAGFTTVNATLK